MPIVTSTYRYKRPPRKRKPQTVEALSIVTIDPKTRVAKKGRRETSPDERAAAKGTNATARTPAGDAQPSTKSPQPANDDGPRKSTVIVVKSGRRRPGLSEAAAEVSNRREPAMAGQLTRLERADPANLSTTYDGGGGNSSRPARKSAIVTVRDRKTVQRQREQQQMAKLMAGDAPKKSAIITMRPKHDVPDMTREEHKRRGDAADALFREMKGKIADALRKSG